MAKCSFCSGKAIYSKDRTSFCKKHFNRFFIKKVEKVLHMSKLFNKKVLIAVSGGKDSSAVAFALKKLNENLASSRKNRLELFHINLGISEFSEDCLASVKELSKLLNLKLHVVSLVDITQKSLEEIAKNRLQPICGICGTIKRYLFNKFAFENGFDFIATGHNLDDEALLIFNALISRNITNLVENRVFKPSIPEKKLVGRVKPLYFLQEEETLLYANINEIPYSKKDCKYSKKKRVIKNREILSELEKKVPIKKALVVLPIKLSSYMKDKKKEEDYKKCKLCSYPTIKRDICRFCELIRVEK